mmetsp:Transcript_1582/g.4049  ORF Transcript_1582/g.4049 Transcript_1582/m.4049 type:complete len:476 (+) Transcript_1582:498-1925(+)
MHDALGRLLLHEEEPPLIELGLWEERCVHGTHRLIPLDVLPQHLHCDGRNVAHDDLGLVLYLDLGLELDLPQVGAEGIYVRYLSRLHAGEQRLSLLSIHCQKLCKGGDRVPAVSALLHSLFLEMRNLQELGTSNVERLDQAAPEVDHRLRSGEPLAHAGDLDHGLRDLHRVAEHRVQVLAKLRRHEAVAPLHVGPDEELVLHDSWEREDTLLVLHNLTRELLYVIIVRRSRGHAPALRAGGQELWAGLTARRLGDVFAEEVQRVNQDAVSREVLGPLVVADERDRHHQDDHNKENEQDVHVIVLFKKEEGQSNANLRGLRAIRVAVLLPVPPCDVVGEGGIGLGDLDEPGGGQRVVRVLVRVVDQGELPVGPLDLRVRGFLRDLKDLEGVELVNLLLVPELQRGAYDAGPHDDQDGLLQDPEESDARCTSPGLRPCGLDLLHHVGGRTVAELIACGILLRVVLQLLVGKDQIPKH